MKLLVVFNLIFLSCLLSFLDCKSQNKWAFLSGYLVSDAVWLSPRPYPTPLSVKGSPWMLGTSFKPSVREHTSGGLVNNNDLYIYGGQSLESNYASDLWIFDISQQKWAFISDKGTSNVSGSIGLENPNFTPGGRNRMGSAVDKEGNIWFFGGLNNGYISADLWRFNTRTKMWSFWGDFGSSDTQPVNRYRSRIWFDDNDDLWLFGGVTDAGGNNSFNDLWKFNKQTKKWTFVSGDRNAGYCKDCPNGKYPTANDPATTIYFPRSRSDYAHWKDNDGNFWIYGGYAESHGSDEYGDLWKFSISTQKWALISGSQNLNIPKTATNPGSRNAPYCWVGSDGKLYFFGGQRQYWHFLSDTWRVDPTNGSWEAVDNVIDWNTPPISSGIGNEQTTNRPGSCVNTMNHMTTGTHTYLFNGYGTGLNYQLGFTGALWRYTLGGYDANLKPIAQKDTIVLPYKAELVFDIIQNDSLRNSVNLSTIDIDIQKAGIQDSLVTTNGTFKVLSDGKIAAKLVSDFSGSLSFSYTFQNTSKYISNTAEVKLYVYECNSSTLDLGSSSYINGNYDFNTDGKLEMSIKVNQPAEKITFHTKSKSSVTLKPGFSVNSLNNSTFTAEIGGCSN